MNKVEVVPSIFKLFEIYPRVELLSRFLRFLVYLEAINEPSGSTWYALNLFNVQKKEGKKIAYVFDDLYLRSLVFSLEPVWLPGSQKRVGMRIVIRFSLDSGLRDASRVAVIIVKKGIGKR